jgi:ABC-type lipoprotein release transport system permease subunit
MRWLNHDFVDVIILSVASTIMFFIGFIIILVVGITMFSALAPKAAQATGKRRSR